MNQLLVPRSELNRRIELLQQHLAATGLDGALLHGITNLYYFSGTAQQAHLWVPAAEPPVLLVRRVLERARKESATDRIMPLASLKQLPDIVGSARRIGMELDILSVSLFQVYQRTLSGIEVLDIGAYTRLQRSVKSTWEVERIRESAAVADLAFREIVAALKEGMTELDLSAAAEAAERKLGGQGILRWRAATGFECPKFHVLAGESALAFSFADTPFGGEGLTPAAPFGGGHRRIHRGMPVCVDFPTAYNGYIHDQTRTLSVGPVDPELAQAHQVCLGMLAMVQTEARPGVTGDQLWTKCLAFAADHGLEPNFMGWAENRVKFVGHGVGLELDELPVLAPRQSQPLASGNVIAVEPKFFFPGKGAVGAENTYLITAAGCEQLTVTEARLWEVDN